MRHMPRFDTTTARPVSIPATGREGPFPKALGPMPEATLACWIDLGLTDAEIARYFGLKEGQVSALVRHLDLRTGEMRGDAPAAG